LRISGWACVQNNNPGDITIMIHQTTTITATAPTNLPQPSVSEKTTWGRDVGLVILGGGLVMLVVVGMWAWVRFGRRITTPARHFLAMVIMSLLYFCIDKTLKFNNCLKIYLFNRFLYKNIKNLNLL
jgi:hypothetical protein